MTEALHLDLIAKPALIRVGGPPLSGKTTLASSLSKATGAAHLDIDAVRVEMFGKNPVLDPELESDQLKQAYTRMYLEAVSRLHDGQSVVLSATYRIRRYRRYVEALAKKNNASLYPIWLEPTEISEVIKRLRQRNRLGGDSNILTLEEYWRVLQGLDPIDEPGTLILDAHEDTDRLVQQVLTHFSFKRPVSTD